MNLKQKWYALPVWGQSALALLVIPLLPIIVVGFIASVILGILLTFAMDCVEDALDIIYKDEQ